MNCYLRNSLIYYYFSCNTLATGRRRFPDELFAESDPAERRVAGKRIATLHDFEASAAFAIPRHSLRSGQSPPLAGRRTERRPEIFFSSPKPHSECFSPTNQQAGYRNYTRAMPIASSTLCSIRFAASFAF